MAIIDKQLIFSDEQDVPTTTDETISTNVTDLAKANANVGEGRPAYLKILVTEAVTHAGALSITFKFYSHSAVAVMSGTAHFSVAVAKASLTKGALFTIPVPIPSALGQYIGLSYTASDTTATAGKFSAWIDLG